MSKEEEAKRTEKIFVLAILEKQLSPSTPVKRQLAEIAGNVAAKLETDSVKVMKV